MEGPSCFSVLFLHVWESGILSWAEDCSLELVCGGGSLEVSLLVITLISSLFENVKGALLAPHSGAHSRQFIRRRESPVVLCVWAIMRSCWCDPMQ